MSQFNRWLLIINVTINFCIFCFVLEIIKTAFTYPILVINFPWMCKKLVIKRLFTSKASNWLSSSSSVDSVEWPIIGSRGANRRMRLPPSGWIQFSRRRWPPSKRCSFSFNLNRFFSSRRFWLFSYYNKT